MSLTLNANWLSLQWIRHTPLSNKRSNASIYVLYSQIKQWNIARIASNHLYGLEQNLSIENIHDLKEIIHTSIRKATIQQAEVIVDQLLFLAIGAIQIESQNGSNDAWQLVNRAIQNIAAPNKDRTAYRLSLVAILLALSAYISMSSHHHSNLIAPTAAPAMTVRVTPDPVTISMLELTYHKMKAGTCQMPQAAMLASEQRHAFLMFVNAGTIDVHHVEDLRQALGYVNCLYPQELMHPKSA